MTQLYVTFLSPGSFFPNERQQKLNSRSDDFKVPENCFAYYFWEREEVEHNGEMLYGGQKNKSGRYYFGKEMTADEIKESIPGCDTLLSNMRSNGWETVVRTRMGNFQPLEKEDIIVAE